MDHRHQAKNLKTGNTTGGLTIRFLSAPFFHTYMQKQKINCSMIVIFNIIIQGQCSKPLCKESDRDFVTLQVIVTNLLHCDCSFHLESTSKLKITVTLELFGSFLRSSSETCSWIYLQTFHPQNKIKERGCVTKQPELALIVYLSETLLNGWTQFFTKVSPDSVFQWSLVKKSVNSPEGDATIIVVLWVQTQFTALLPGSSFN